MGLLGQYNYWIAILLMMCGFYTVISRHNLIKQIVGLNIFQTSVFLLYISLANVAGATAPVVVPGATHYSNPLPHVLILTAIVVNVATTAVALALVVRIKAAYGSIEDDEIHDGEESRARGATRNKEKDATRNQEGEA